jgi:transcriptional regulator with XRE-family HTH domain
MTALFAERVRGEIRAEMGRQRVTQVELSRRLKITQQALSQRLRGDVDFRLDEVEAIALALNVPVRQFTDRAVSA